MIKKYDNVVVGSGASGLTAALLLADQGRSVLLLEKANFVGGALARFRRRKVPLDTGFHFTGGLAENGLLDQMLRVLGIRDEIRPIWFRGDTGHRIVFESVGLSLAAAPGPDFEARLKAAFPGEEDSIDRYFSLMKSVHGRTMAGDLRMIARNPDPLAEDFLTLDEAIREMTDNETLRCFLSVHCVCYGVKPSEISFANHCRMVYEMHTSLARIDGGGDAIIRAVVDRLNELDVEIRLETSIARCADVEGDRVGRFVLDTGESVACEECVLTMHPRAIVDLLPKERFSKAFGERVCSFERSIGFFVVFGVIDAAADVSGAEPTMVSLFPTNDMDEMLDPGYRGERPLFVLTHTEVVSGRRSLIVTALEPSYAEDVEEWQDSTVRDRPDEYSDYKDRKAKEITARILSLYPDYAESFRFLDAATMLTFRDYLNTPDGAAYGVKQKIGQFNLVGRTRLRNVLVAGQSALLPGLVGAMMSAFVASRNIMGKEAFARYVSERLDK